MAVTAGENTLAAAGDGVGPCAAKRAILFLSGTMTAGYVIIEYQPNNVASSSTWYPGDAISTTKLAQVPNQAETGYGYSSLIEVPAGMQVRARASANFAGSLAAYLRQAD